MLTRQVLSSGPRKIFCIIFYNMFHEIPTCLSGTCSGLYFPIVSSCSLSWLLDLFPFFIRSLLVSGSFLYFSPSSFPSSFLFWFVPLPFPPSRSLSILSHEERFRGESCLSGLWTTWFTFLCLTELPKRIILPETKYAAITRLRITEILTILTAEDDLSFMNRILNNET